MNKINKKSIKKKFKKYLALKKLPKNNQKKINLIFNFWLNAFEYVLHNFDKSQISKLNKKIINKKLSLANAIKEVELEQDLESKLSENKFLNFVSFFLIPIKNFNLTFGLTNNSFVYLYSYIFLKYKIFKKPSYIESQKINFVKTLVRNQYLEKKFYKFFLNFLPDNFFQKYSPILNDVNIKVYPINFYFENNYINFFFKSKNIRIIGHQHGHGYNCFKNNIFYKIEKNISEKFIQLFPLNNFFGRFSKKELSYSLKPRIIWALRRKISKFDLSLLNDFGEIMNYKKGLSLLDKKISNLNNSFFSINNNNYLYKPKYCNKVSKKNEKIENYIKKNDILLFDSIGPSLIHFAILNNVIFYFFLSKKYSKKNLNIKYYNFLNALYQNKFIFYFHEFNEFKNEMYKIQKDKIYLKNRQTNLTKIISRFY